MIRVGCWGIAVLTGMIVSSLPAKAAIIQYQDRAAWESAAGPLDFTENFDSYPQYTSFRIADGPLSVNGFSIVETGTLTQSDANMIDVRNGVTPYAYGATDFGLTTIDLTFSFSPPGSPISVSYLASAFGADFNGVNGAEQLVIDVFDSLDNLLGTLNPTLDDTFLGFITDAGEQVAYLHFRSLTNSGGRESFWMDNVGIVAAVSSVPEPSSLALVLTGTIGLVCYGWRKRKSFTIRH